MSNTTYGEHNILFDRVLAYNPVVNTITFASPVIFDEGVTYSGPVDYTGGITVTGGATVDTLTVTGNETVDGNLVVTGSITGGTLNTAGAATVGSLNATTGNITTTNDVIAGTLISNSIHAETATTITLSGNNLNDVGILTLTNGANSTSFAADSHNGIPIATELAAGRTVAFTDDGYATVYSTSNVGTTCTLGTTFYAIQETSWVAGGYQWATSAPANIGTGIVLSYVGGNYNKWGIYSACGTFSCSLPSVIQVSLFINPVFTGTGQIVSGTLVGTATSIETVTTAGNQHNFSFNASGVLDLTYAFVLGVSSSAPTNVVTFSSVGLNVQSISNGLD